MTKTAQDLVTEALRELREIGVGETPDAEQKAEVLRKYTGVLQELRDRGKAFWDQNAIPERVFSPLAKILASECASLYGKQYDPGDAWMRLVALAHTESAREPVRIEYF